MNGASDALNKLRDAITAPVAAVALAVKNASRAQAQFKAADDLLPGVADAAMLILALEHLSDEAGAAHKAARAALAEIMEESGATSLDIGSHTVTVSNGRQSVEIVDAAAVPAEMMTDPKPVPDKKKIAAFLKGNVVNWARTVTGGPILTIRKSEA